MMELKHYGGFFKSGLKGGLLKAKGKWSSEARLKTRKAFELAQATSNAGRPIATDDTFDFLPIEIHTNALHIIKCLKD